MTKEEKRTLFCELLASRPRGEAAAKLAKWCHSSASTVYKWQIPEGPWPADEEKEALLWAFFGYELDERGNPIEKKNPLTGDRKEELSSDDEVFHAVIRLITDHLRKRKTKEGGGKEMWKEYEQIAVSGERGTTRPKKPHESS